jgi:integrase
LSVERLKLGSYRVRWYDGKGDRASKTFSYKQDAEDWDAEIKRAKQTGRIGRIDADLQPLSGLVAEHFAKRTNLTQRTQSTYRDAWASNVDGRIKGKQDFHEIADLPLRAITPKVVEKWRDEKLAEGKGYKSLTNAMLIMQGAFRLAMRDEKVEKNPVQLVDKPKKPHSRNGTAISMLSPREVEKLRAQLKPADRLLVSLIAYAGLRPSEATALERRHVGTRTLRIEQSSDKDGTLKPTKTKQHRNVRLVKPLADELRAWLKANPGEPSDLIFGSWTDSKLANWKNRIFKPAAQAAKVTIDRPYHLRHAAASLWLHEQLSYLQVAVWMGHSPTVLLDTYGHIIEDLDLKKPVDAAKLIRDARRSVGDL